VTDALEIFRKGQVLPQSLGAGIWNHCKLVPLKYFEAVCLERLGDKVSADEIFRYIATIGIEYFSNMHLKELPYYQAWAWRHLGEELKAQRLITKYRREWKDIDKVIDNGFFGTTPFFISFTDNPKQLRRAQHCYLNALIADFTGDKEKAQAYISESLALNSENLPALTFKIQGFLK
jgi:tetratricopeptide (TPR) repeat protein